MSREVRRVPLVFEWPLDKVWWGYVLPEELRLPTCPTCRGDGLSREARAVEETFYPHQISWTDRERAEQLAWHDKIGQAEVDHLLEQGRLRTWNRETRTWESLPRTAAEVNETQRRGGLGGHDGINRMCLVQFRCERLGIPMACTVCAGEGNVATAEQRAANEAWERTDPPFGEGWQLWETVSEGSPISPVFPDRTGLVTWLATDYRQVGSHRPLTREQAEAFVAAGSSIGSGVFVDGRHLSGEAAVAELGGTR